MSAPGIGAVHCVLPREFVKVTRLPEFADLDRAAADFAAGCGVAEVGVLDEPAADLAAQACRELLAHHDIPEPDVLVLVAPRAPEVLLGSDVTRVQSAVGLGRAFPFALDGLGCTGSSAAWALGADLLHADASRRCVLITHASRPTGLDRVRYPVTVIGDGAYAMAVVRGGRPVLRAHRAETDGSFHDLFRVDYRRTPWYEWREECASPDRYRFELALRSRERMARLVEQVLADAAVDRSRVRATVMQNVTASAYEFYTALLGLPIHPVCAAHLSAYGHLGAMDVVLNLDRVLATGELTEGDLVLVLNNSPVAAWAVTLWEV
ncbi:3-oxoacyl-ACP synthase [Amycolatopsis balhimycina DSM 5908]|uniref:3-oxoacyl-ACP synthase n=1 Tax=Amycolatopsis balhimycina DSM 5908 TaxID=1081091 RepID=A0A428WTN9_AMYBA|nr:3-oxoacyl-[acyl-carrier-protein] synthase III C-terminal domain-containing protein [Amycolatopsis balhimycina]RSM46437.1 3-oxoacyl-ACP synthase [Amycolatopsis balhimycina DSM 5908]